MKLSNNTYDIAKWIALVALPALATLYFALSQVWGLPYGGEIVATITAIDTFIGALLGISSSKYANSDASVDGSLVIDTVDPEKDVYRMELTTSLDEIANKSKVSFKVDPQV